MINIMSIRKITILSSFISLQKALVISSIKLANVNKIDVVSLPSSLNILKNTLSYAEAKYKKIIMNKKNKNKDIKKQKNNSVSYNNIDGNKTYNIKNDDNNKIYDKFINK